MKGICGVLSAAAAAIVIGFRATPAAGKVLWSAAFESYSNGQNVKINTSASNDTFRALATSAYANWATFKAAASGSLLDFDTGNFGMVFVATNPANRYMGAEFGNLTTPLVSGMVWMCSVDMAIDTTVAGNWIFYPIEKTGAFSPDTVTGNGRPNTERWRCTTLINWTGQKVTLPFNVGTPPPWDVDNPDACNPFCCYGFQRYKAGGYGYNPNTSTGMDVPIVANPNPGTEVHAGRWFLYGGTGDMRLGMDNAIIVDSIDDQFISPDGAWRNIRALRVGTRPTSSYLTTNAVAPTFSEQFAVSFASGGDASHGTALDIVNTGNMDEAGNNYGWIGFDGSVSGGAPIELCLDLGGPNAAAVSYVLNELRADANLRGYALSTSDERLIPYLGGGWDAVLTLPATAANDFVWSWRFGGNGNVYLDRVSVYKAPPTGTVVLIH